MRGVAANIRELRRQAGLTLAELAAAAALGKSTLAQLESGRGNPSVETLWAIAAALEVPFARIVEEQ
ncbi:MAG: helix-turn-helix domain-containing protein, partial [Solirubrobacteraceae bacterium]